MKKREILMTEKLWRFVNHLTAGQGFAIALLLSILLSVVDGLTGFEVSFSFFYLVPVFLIAWTGNAISVWLMAVIDASLWQLSNYYAGDVHEQSWIYIWNAASRGVFFIVTGLLIIRVKELLNKEMMISRQDPLTGLLNRRGFEQAFEFEAARYLRNPVTLGLIAVDLDHFKQLNDRAGHAEGDKLLITFATAGRLMIRSSDYFARIGGDEFIILIVSADKNEILEVAQRFQKTVESFFSERGWPVGISQGIAIHTSSSGVLSLPELMERADKQLYCAKQQGRARICIET